MNEETDPIVPSGWITVVIRDDSTLRHCNDAPRFRSVRLRLTVEQRRELLLSYTDSIGPAVYHETIGQCFWEDQP